MKRRFKPWRGNDYRLGLRNGLTTLIVGESHYDCIDSELLTIQSVESHLAGGGWRFNKTVEAIARGLAEPLAAENFWSRVGFCNFVQQPMVDLTQRPSRPDCEAAWPALLETIDELEPDVMLVFSRLVWDYSPLELRGMCADRSCRLPPCDGSLYRYDRADAPGEKKTPLIAAYFRHPSRLGASIGIWQVFAEHVWSAAAENS